MSAARIPLRVTHALRATYRNLVHHMVAQDWILLSFHSWMAFQSTTAPDSPEANEARTLAVTLLSISLATVVLVRGAIMPSGWLRGAIYRLGIFAPVVASYFEMGTLLRALRPVLLDAELLAIDEAIFRVTPAVWLQRLNDVGTIEWFSFFYYSYFYILTAFIVPTLFLDRGRRQLELLAGAMCVACIGHLGYTLVPGIGPYAYMAFPEAIHGGFWWRQVEYTVAHAGSMMDIFPSLHTAFPTYFALHALGHRDRAPYRYVWPVIAFFAANIIVATLLLRWHYGIDVIAGLLLAFTARRLAVWLAGREIDRGLKDDRQPVWEALWAPRCSR